MPANQPILEQRLQSLDNFLTFAQQSSQPIAVVTSGGTRVPLEKNMVRFIDNFSGGDRGAISAEYFLSQGYRVLFLYREGTRVPFTRAFSRTISDRVDARLMQQLVADHADHVSLHLDPAAAALISSEASLTRAAMNQHALHYLPFLSVQDYLYLLEQVAKRLSVFGPRVCFYLAAAVSDFFIPDSQMVEHKIQSTVQPGTAGGLDLSLSPVPKCLGKLSSDWSPHAFVVSFKLETDIEILRQKAESSLDKYGVHAVIANLLQTRKEVCYYLYPSQTETETEAVLETEREKYRMETVRRAASDLVIEAPLLARVISHHGQFISDQYQAIAKTQHLSLETEREAVRRVLAARSTSLSVSVSDYLRDLAFHYAALSPLSVQETEQRQATERGNRAIAREQLVVGSLVLFGLSLLLQRRTMS